MAGIHDLRAEQRQELALEISFPEMLLLLAELGKVHLVVALLRQAPTQDAGSICRTLPAAPATRGVIAAICSAAVMWVTLSVLLVFSSVWSYREPTRTMKNSSILLPKMAANLMRSPKGTVFFFGKRRERGCQKSSQLSSRLMKMLSGFFQMDLLLFIFSAASPPAQLSVMRRDMPLTAAGIGQRCKGTVLCAVCHQCCGLPAGRSPAGRQFLCRGRVDVDKLRLRRRVLRCRDRGIGGGWVRLPHRGNQEQRTPR